MQPFLLALGKKIKALRNDKKISQEELAFSADIDVTFVSRIERGTGNPSYLTLIKIASALQVNVKCLIDVQENKDDEENAAE